MLGILERDAGLTAVCWNLSLPNVLAIGSEDGEIIIVDARKGSVKVLAESFAFSRPVHGLSFNQNLGR